MNIEDGDLKERLKLAKERILRLEQENAELLDMRTLILVLAKSIDAWSKPPKKSPAERRAELDRLWHKSNV